ncbi:MAG: electron transfer flavoprotein beta subunit, partial [Actinomycetota bacterium]|nr:electron transfer flavoprotein beta subunit [Actinomycetota bacterium]
VKIQRQTEAGYDIVEASLPAVASVTAGVVEPRYPSFKGILAAKKKPVETYGLADLGVDAGQVGSAGAWSKVESFEAAPPRQAGTVVTDDGEGADKLLEFLTSKKFV